MKSITEITTEIVENKTNSQVTVTAMFAEDTEPILLTTEHMYTPASLSLRSMIVRPGVPGVPPAYPPEAVLITAPFLVQMIWDGRGFASYVQGIVRALFSKPDSAFELDTISGESVHRKRKYKILMIKTDFSLCTIFCTTISSLEDMLNKPLKKISKYKFNPFTAEVAIMRLLGSAPKSHLCDQTRRSEVTGLSDLMTLFIDLGCLYCKQTQRAFNVFKNTLN
jgi:hypothetical protein